MTFNISTLDIRQRLGDILNRVALRQDQFIIDRKGVPLAALVSVEKIEQMERAAKLHLLDVLQRQSARLSQIEADNLANLAKHQSRLVKVKKR